ncbi:MAG: IS200/IS605 family transposase [Xenococcaceae cyanobacterium]
MNIVDSITWLTILGQQYRHDNHSVSLINYHFVWCPKRRKKVLVEDIAKRLRELIWQKASELECVVIALEIDPDHIHLFLGCPPTIAPYQIVHRIKGASSRILRQEFPELLKLPSLWTHSYFVSTAGNVSRETIKKYIQNHSAK